MSDAVPPARARVPWWGGALGALASYVLGQVAGGVGAVVGIVLLVVVAGRDLDPTHPAALLLDPVVFIPMLALTGVVQAALPFGFASIAVRRRVVEALGLAHIPVVPTILAPIGMLALGPLSDLATSLMAKYLPSWTFGSLDELNELGRAGPWLLMVYLMAVLPGLSEELVFRGLLQRSIQGKRLGMVISAVFFAFAHVDPHHVAGVLPLGFYLAWVAMRTDSTWPTMLAHVANNTLAVSLSRAFPDSADTPLPWWASLVGLAIAAPVVFAIARLTRPDKGSLSTIATA